MAETRVTQLIITHSRCGRLDQAGFRDDLMDVLIVKLDGDVIHNLNIEGNGDAFGAALRMSQQAVVVAPPTPKSFPIVGESESWNEDDVELSDVDVWTLRIRLPDIHLATVQILHGTHLSRLKRLMFDLEEAGADSLCVQGRQQMRHEIRLIFQSAKEGHSDTGRPGGGQMLEVGSDVYTRLTARGLIHGTQSFPHGLAQRGFVVHGVRGWDGWNARELADALADRQECLSYFRAVRVSAAVQPRA
jgi:hypothetical protein